MPKQKGSKAYTKFTMDKTDDNLRSPIAKFDGKDFAVWRAQVEAYLTAKGDVWLSTILNPKPRRIGALTRGAAEQVAARESEREARENLIILYDECDRKVKSLLLLSLDTKNVRHVLHCETPREIWDRLKSIHEQASEASRLVLQREFDLKMGVDESATDYISRAEYLYSKLKNSGVKSVDETTLVNKIVSGLTRRYVNFMSQWANNAEDKYKLVNLIPKLSAEEQLMNQFQRQKPETSALHTESRGRGRLNNNYGRNTRNNSKDNDNKNNYKNNRRSTKQKNNKRSNNNDNNPEEKPFACWTCGDYTHMRRDCPTRKGKTDKKRCKIHMSVNLN